MRLEIDPSANRLLSEDNEARIFYDRVRRMFGSDENCRPGYTGPRQAIETYEIPRDLVGTKNSRGEPIPERIFPVFRDEEELAANASLSSAITRALDNSDHLVVICSPRAVESSYVADEIAHSGQSPSGQGEPTGWHTSSPSQGISPYSFLKALKQ